MQLYLIEYQTHRESHTDLGRAVVQALNSTEAIQAVAVKFNLPISRSDFKAELIEAGVMQLSHRTVAPEAAPNFHNGASKSDETWAPPVQFNCQVLAIAAGQDEFHAFKRLAHAVINKCNHQASEQDRHVTRLMLNAEPRILGHEKLRGIEAFGLYKGKGLMR